MTLVVRCHCLYYMNHIYDEGLICIDIQLCDEFIIRNNPRSEKPEGPRLRLVTTHPLLLV